MLDVVVEGGEAHASVLKDYQLNKVRGNVTHVDLQEVRLDQTINASGAAPSGSASRSVRRKAACSRRCSPSSTSRRCRWRCPRRSTSTSQRSISASRAHLTQVALPEGRQAARRRGHRVRRRHAPDARGGARGRRGSRGRRGFRRARQPRATSPRPRATPERAAPAPRNRPAACACGRVATAPRMTCSSPALAIPAGEYARNRHNVGWRVVDELAAAPRRCVEREVQREARRDPLSTGTRSPC